MDIHKYLREGGNPDELEQHLMDLDSTFRFKCRRCGKCCKNQDTIIFTPRDIYNIAHKFGKSMEQVIEETSEVYPGRDSRMPIVHMVPRGPKNACPLLVDGRCSVHDCKPTVCALFPLGRVVWFDRTLPLEQQLDNIQVRYIVNDIDCGSAKRVNTVREWLARFGIAEDDEFFIRWNRLFIRTSSVMRKLEEAHCPPALLVVFWRTVYKDFYLNYDTSKAFMPQFLSMADQVEPLIRELYAPPIHRGDPNTGGTICKNRNRSVIRHRSSAMTHVAVLWRRSVTGFTWTACICSLWHTIRTGRRVSAIPTT